MQNEHINIRVGTSRTTVPDITSLWLYRIHEPTTDTVNYFITNNKTLAFINDVYAVEFNENKAQTHTDDFAVDAFANSLKEKMTKKRVEGASGWSSRSLCGDEKLLDLFQSQLISGDVVDLGNYLMMLHWRGVKNINPVVPL